MAKYSVTLYCEVGKTYEVEANSAEDALEKAYDLDKDVPLSEYNYIDRDGYCVHDEKGNIVDEV
jgi:hypothetical protein